MSRLQQLLDDGGGEGLREDVAKSIFVQIVSLGLGAEGVVDCRWVIVAAGERAYAHARKGRVSQVTCDV